MKLEKIKTFEDACKIEGLDPKAIIPDFSFYPERDRKAMIAHAKLVVIIRAVNRILNNGDEWAPDWNNYKWDKYYAWFWMAGGSSGFRFSGCVVWLAFGFARRLSPLLYFPGGM